MSCQWCDFDGAIEFDSQLFAFLEAACDSCREYLIRCLLEELRAGNWDGMSEAELVGVLLTYRGSRASS